VPEEEEKRKSERHGERDKGTRAEERDTRKEKE